MADFRDIKNAARRGLHEKMKVRAVYYATPDSDPEYIYVRVHGEDARQGDQKGTSLASAQQEVRETFVLFDLAEVTPVRNALVILSSDEAYRLGQSKPKDGFSIRVAAARLRAADYAGKETP